MLVIAVEHVQYHGHGDMWSWVSASHSQGCEDNDFTPLKLNAVFNHSQYVSVCFYLTCIMQGTDSYICKSNEKGENPDKKTPKEALESGSALFAKY